MSELLSDYHVHTFLSSCAKSNAVPDCYIRLCLQNGIKEIGFADHLWDSDISGASAWYEPQNIEHVMGVRSLISDNTRGVRVLFGCEVEMDKDNRISITKEHAELFDFVLIPFSHLHMKGLTIDSEVTDLDEVRKLLLTRFMKALDSGIATGIAHPFTALGFFHVEQQLLEGFTDGEYISSFNAAKEAGVSIELNSHILKAELPLYMNRYPYEYVRMMSIAHECGCSFYIGSDAHSPEAFNTHEKLVDFAKVCGITNFIQFTKR